MKIIPRPLFPSDQILRGGAVEDGPVVEIVGMNHRGKTMKVSFVRMTFRPVGGKWVCGSLMAQGHILKNDGQPGKVEATREYTDVMTNNDTPAWARETVLHFQPDTEVPTSVQDSLTIEA